MAFLLYFHVPHARPPPLTELQSLVVQRKAGKEKQKGNKLGFMRTSSPSMMQVTLFSEGCRCVEYLTLFKCLQRPWSDYVRPLL